MLVAVFWLTQPILALAQARENFRHIVVSVQGPPDGRFSEDEVNLEWKESERV